MLKKPLLVVRRSTERPESIDAGFATLVTPDQSMEDAALNLLADPTLPDRLRAIPSPFGDGAASARIAQIATRIADSPADAHLPAD